MSGLVFGAARHAPHKLSDISVDKSDPHPAERASDSAMITLDGLSNEILLQIIRLVIANVKWKQPQPLPILSVLSKRFHALVEPILYSQYKERLGGNPNSTALFLKRALSRPDLAARVKAYRGLACDSHNYDQHQDVACFEEADWVQIKARVEELKGNTQDADAWFAAIRRGDWEAITAVLLSYTINVERLELHGWSYDDEFYPHLRSFFDNARELQEDGKLENPGSMSHVKSIEQQYYDTRAGEGMMLDRFVPLLSLPSVETFNGVGIRDEGSDADALPTFPHIKHLSLDPSSMDHEALNRFLGCFTNLETLHYNSCRLPDDSFLLPKVLAGLEHLKPCLRSLSIFNTNDNDLVDDEMEYWPLGSLAEFERLTKIDMAAGLLLGDGDETFEIDGFLSRQNLVDILPTSIQELRVVYPEEGIGRPFITCDCTEQISSLIAHKSRFPNLTKIDLGWEMILYPDEPSPATPFKHPGATKEEAIKIIAELKAVGVELVLGIQPPQPKTIC